MTLSAAANPLNHVELFTAAAHAARKAQIGKYVGVARVALVVYDILICLGRESRLVWSAKFRVSSVLYYTVRYPVLAYQIFTIASKPTMPHCDTVSQFCFTLSTTFTRIAICLSFIMRAYVVMPKVKVAYVAIGFLSLVGLMSVILDVVQTAQMSCTEASNPLSFVVTFLALTVFDLLSTCLITWGVIHTIGDMGGFRELSSQRVGKLIIQSGALYFFVMTALQIASVVIYFLPQGVYSLVLNNWLITLSTVLVSHFLLDLRELVDGDSGDEYEESGIASMAFADNRGQARKDVTGFSFGLVEDFTDKTYEGTGTNPGTWGSTTAGRRTTDENHGRDSMSWPLEELATRARQAEDELESGRRK